MSLFKSTYFENILLLVSGAGFSQLIPVLFSPILGRIYSPHEFGVLAIFMAFCYILGMLSTGLYELAVMLPKKDVAALNLLAWVTISSSVFGVFICFALYLFSYIPRVEEWQTTFKYHYLLPLGIFFVGSFQGYTYWLNRKKEYKILNFCRIGQSMTIVAVSLILGYLGFKDSGLILGFLAGGLVTLLPLLIVLFRKKSKINKERILQNIKEYKSYPKLMLPTAMMNTTASYTPVFSIDRFFNSNIVGSYSMASRMLTAPVAVISVVIGQVYYKKIADIVNFKEKSLMKEFFRTTILLLIVSIVIFLPLFFWGEELMVFVFGNQWSEAGSFVEIIAIATMIKFVVSPLSTIFMAVNKLKRIALWQTIYFCTTLSIFGVGIFFKMDIEKLLLIYVLHECILYLFYYFLMYKIAKKYK